MLSPLTFGNIIHKKRDGKSLSREEIDYVVNGFTHNKIPDYQMSSLLMARLHKRHERQRNSSFDRIYVVLRRGLRSSLREYCR